MNHDIAITKRKLFLLISLLFLSLSVMRLGWIVHHKTPEHPSSENGVIDLRDWRFNDKQTITFDGEWEFYPNVFIDPLQSNSRDHAEKKIVSVPGSWNAHFDDESIQYGTYRLQALLPNHEKSYGITIKDIHSAANVYIDGELKIESGRPAASAEKYKSRLGTYSATFTPDDQTVEIIIHVSNFENADPSGIIHSIKIGTDKATLNDVNLTKTMQLLVTIILLIHSLYAFGLYFMGKGSLRKEVIYFGLILIFVSLSIVVDEDKLILSLLPISSAWIVKLKYLSFAGTLFFMLIFIRYVFQLYKPVTRLILILYSAVSLILLIVPSHLTEYVGHSIMLLNASTYILMFILLLQVVQKGNKNAIFILVSNAINFFNVVWGIAITTGLIEIPFYPIDYIVGIAAFTGYLFKRHIDINNENQKLINKLQEVDEARDQFLINTSHELRNPLHAVINIAQSIWSEEKSVLSKRNSDNLELLIEVGRHMSYTLNDLIDIERIKRKHIPLNVVQTDVHLVASRVVDMVRFLADGKEIEIKLNIPRSFPYVLADENRLIQILFNLLHNAIKHTTNGTITLFAELKHKTATIHIEDTGEGISEENIPKLFQPYEQINSDLSTGIGLGLNISKQLIELQGGSLYVQSTLDVGSTFSFTLPLANAKEEAESIRQAATILEPETFVETSEVTPAHRISKSGTEKLNILIVDDDPINLTVLKNLLDTTYNVSPVTNGQEALNAIQNKEWDLVISDVMMPHMSGYELTEKIRKHYSLSELPIILLTARGVPEDIHTAFRVGANDYIAKPVESVELTSRVTALTELKLNVRDLLKMEAAWLQAQIKPHFVFNTLNTIASLAEIDTARMIKLLTEFGNYLRRSFDISNINSLIPIEDELDLVRSYLYIEQIRFGERIQVKFKINEELKIQIPPLSIQPIVENAIEHGILKQIQGGTICIKITIINQHVEIAVTDNGVGMKQEKVNALLHSFDKGGPSDFSGIGLSNTNRRLIKLYGKGLTITSVEDKGTTVRFLVPISEQKRKRLAHPRQA